MKYRCFTWKEDKYYLAMNIDLYLVTQGCTIYEARNGMVDCTSLYTDDEKEDYHDMSIPKTPLWDIIRYWFSFNKFVVEYANQKWWIND